MCSRRWWRFAFLALVLALVLAGCGKSLDRQVVDAIRTFDDLSLDEKQVEILTARESGDTILAEVRVTTAVRLVRREGKWELAEIRLGDRRWEKADHILTLLDEQRLETTKGRLRQLRQAMHRHLEQEGTVPQVETFTALVDVLYPGFLEEAVRLDAWSNPFIYEVNSVREYDLRSAGADGVDGTIDDVSVENVR